MGHPDTQIGAGQSKFPPTAWTLLAQLRDPRDPSYQAYLEHMIGMYWRPIYKFVRLGWKQSNEDAKDLTQSFFVHLMEGNLLDRADPERGNFRTLLLASLRNYLINVQRGAQSIKRGGGRQVVSLDGEQELQIASPAADPQAEFEGQWAREILDRCIEQLGGKIRPPAYAAFKKFHLEGMAVKEIARELKLAETQIAHHLQDARNALRALVMGEIRRYVQDDQEMLREMETLFQGWR